MQNKRPPKGASCYGGECGIRPALRRRPPRVKTCRRHVFKSPRVRILYICKKSSHLTVRTFFWRRVWDSNPRGREPKRFSRPPRYDHFDNSPNIQFSLVKRAHLKCALFMAQKEGFEPSRAFYTPTPLAGEPLRPLGYFCTLPLKYNSIAHRRCQEVYYSEYRLAERYP